MSLSGKGQVGMPLSENGQGPEVHGRMHRVPQEDPGRCARAQTKARTHTQTLTRTHARARANRHANTRALAPTRTRTHMSAGIHVFCLVFKAQNIRCRRPWVLCGTQGGVSTSLACGRCTLRYDSASQEMLQVLQKCMECQGDNGSAFWQATVAHVCAGNWARPCNICSGADWAHPCPPLRP